MYVQLVLTLRRRGMRWFEDERALRGAVRRIARIGGRRLLLFCVADDHVHLIVEGTRREAGVLACHVHVALRARSTQRTRDTFIEPLAGPEHLRRQVVYLLRQPSKHGLEGHPALWPGSCLPDLIGARVIDGFNRHRIQEALPGLEQESLLHAAGVAVPVGPVSLHDLTPQRIAHAASAALGADPFFQIQNRPIVRARTASAHLARRAGIPFARLAPFLSVTPHTVRRLARRPESTPDLKALHRRLALEEAVQESLLRR